MFPIPLTRNSRKVNLWRAALYGALFMLAVRALHSAVSSDNFFPPDLAEFVGYLLVGIILFVVIGYINNRKIAGRQIHIR